MNPDCEQNMVWKNVKINDEAHMICFMEKNESWKVLLTNLIEIWTETLTDETILQKFQTLNPLLSLEAFDWKQLVMDMLNDIPKHIHTCIVDVSTYQIELRKDKDFVKLKFSLELHKETPQQFWENVTMPLCLSSMELVRRYKILLDLVREKDEEITEYKAVGAELIRKYIATKPFSEELFHIGTTASTATDFVKTFQYIFQFYDEINSTSRVKIETRMNSTSDNNSPKIDENDSKDEFVQKLSQDKEVIKIKSEQEHSNIKEYDEEAGPSNKTSILKISSTSYRIHKLKKNKKTLSDFIS